MSTSQLRNQWRKHRDLDENGEVQSLEIEATSEMAAYRCRPHASMQGTITIE